MNTTSSLAWTCHCGSFRQNWRFRFHSDSDRPHAAQRRRDRCAPPAGDSSIVYSYTVSWRPVYGRGVILDNLVFSCLSTGRGRASRATGPRVIPPCHRASPEHCGGDSSADAPWTRQGGCPTRVAVAGLISPYRAVPPRRSMPPGLGAIVPPRSAETCVAAQRAGRKCKPYWDKCLHSARAARRRT